LIGMGVPVIFIHGIAGSELWAGNDQIWPSLSPFDVADLALLPGGPTVEAKDVVREFHGNVYNVFLDHMVNDLGYSEYKLEGNRSRLTSDHMLNSLNGARPNLFVFPYDWRRDNATHTATLKTYIQKIRQLHDNSKVQIVAHSMGGLVTRRFLLDYGNEDVDKVVTVGSPLWGAVKPIYLLLTGAFYEAAGGALDLINGNQMKASLATMPGLHQLVAAPPFLSNSGPLFWENGWDFNGDGDTGPYSTSQLYAMVDDLVRPMPSASQANQNFHNFQNANGHQDNWSGDTSGLGIMHFVGIQAVNHTVASVTARNFAVYSLMGVVSGTTHFGTRLWEGDGTVPTLSARRLPGYLAPGTVVHEIREPLLTATDKQPAGRSAEHTALMSNYEVWDKMSRFLGTGPWSPSGSPPSAPPAAPVMASSMEVAPSGTPPEIVIEQPDGMALVDGGAVAGFGTLNLSSSGEPVTFTIRNVGGEDLTGISLSKDGTHGHDFTVSNPGSTTVQPGQSTTFTVTFAPTTAGGHRGGERIAVLHIASNDTDETPFDINLTGEVAAGRKQVFVIGTSYIQIRNAAGDANTKLSEIVARRVPGTEVQYGGSAPWVQVSFGADESITLEKDPDVAPFGPMNIAVTEYDSAGTAFSFQRYRFSPGSQSWQGGIAPELQPDMRVDQNNDGTYAPGEAVAPTHSNTGNTVDATQPTVTLTLADNAGGILLALTGHDGAQPVPSLHYSLDGGPVQAYSSQLLFPKEGTRVVKAFAEDAMGNTSGLIQTTINPAVAIGAGAIGMIDLEWSASDGYLLEESTTLTGGWTPSSAAVNRSGMTHRATVPVGGGSQKFFRLRSEPVAR
jgi:pimeloyl-ACP methyl ester carboxylesterase